MVAVPDFAAGAMENWGYHSKVAIVIVVVVVVVIVGVVVCSLVTYRNTALLYNENRTSAQVCMSLAAHARAICS